MILTGPRLSSPLYGLPGNLSVLTHSDLDAEVHACGHELAGLLPGVPHERTSVVLKNWLIPFFTSASLVLAPVALAAPLAQSQACPLVAESDVSAVIGTTMRVSPFMVVVDGSDTQCLFDGSGMVDGVLVGRYGGFFGSGDVQPFSAGQQRIEFLLPRGSVVDLSAVEGIGDAAAWATARDPSAAPDSLGRLLVRRDADAFVVGIPNGSDAREKATSLAQVLLTQP
jgi:hypothetical protein